MKRSIHVFASDFLPYPGCPRTAGGNRSMQVISALRAAGHRVTVSMPLTAHLSRQYAQPIVANFSAEELWCSERFFEPEIVLNRMQPDVAVYCNVNCFHTVRQFARDIVHVIDLYGPLQFEALLLDNPDYDAVIADGRRLADRCAELVDKFRSVDYLLTVSERQKYFWSAYCTLAGFSFEDLNVSICPVAFDTPQVTRKTAERLTVVYAGGFYPWQRPDRGLRRAAEALDKIEGATLHIFGGPHAGLPNEKDVDALLAELQRHRSVQYHGYRPVEEVIETLSTAWCALELMEQNIERELAITGRTVEFLSTGTPVIYNNYATLSKLIEQYQAGWTISPEEEFGLERTFAAIHAGGRELAARYSANARRLAESEFNAATSMEALTRLCAGDIRKRVKPGFGNPAVRSGKAAGVAKVLAISPAPTGALGELRILNPLRALEREKLIDGFTCVNAAAELLQNALQHDRSVYEAVIVHRAVPRRVYCALAKLSVPFIQEVDDNLLAPASYRREPPETEILDGLFLSEAVTVPNPRLVGMLEKYAHTPLAHKSFVTPNALPFPSEAAEVNRGQPTRILWIQSDIAALSGSRDAVIRAVEQFSRKYSLPVVLIGRNVLEQPRFSHQEILGEIDFGANLELLETGPASLGVAPLETEADPPTLDFIAGKSDLKILLFAGYGHACVFSAAPPYSDSPLQACGSMVGNCYAEWLDALEYQYREGWRQSADHARFVQDERNMGRVAREAWAPAVQSCVLTKPVTGAELYEAWMADNGDAAAVHREQASIASRSQQEVAALRRELAELRQSYSWKVTAPLRKLTKALLEKRGLQKRGTE